MRLDPHRIAPLSAANEPHDFRLKTAAQRNQIARCG
jgi:hypothetical protein